MSGIHRRELANGVQVIWASPLSGFGHIADEQPMPYLHDASTELTPRFGGEERLKASGIESIPLPYGQLDMPWPWTQRLFNLPRRRINIYWRNMFRSRTRADRMFYFLDQLEFQDGQDGFVGRSPVMDFSRAFAIEGNAVRVSDAVTFKTRIKFHELFLCPWAELEVSGSVVRCKIETSLLANHSYPIKSSTGSARWHAHKITDASFTKGDQLTWTCLYQVT